MRLTNITLPVLMGTLILSGCSARQTGGPTDEVGVGGPGRSDSGYSNYDNDPPRSYGNGRMAIQPNPVPPARGISHIRGISHTVTLIRKSECAEADGKVPKTACTEEGCSVEGCDTDHCGEGYLSKFTGACQNGLCVVRDKCAAGGHSVRNFYDDEVTDRLHRWKTYCHGKVQKLRSDGCAEDACGDAACGSQECGDTCRPRLLCPCPEPKTVSGTPCVPEYGCPCETPAECTPEGCDRCDSRGGLLDGLKGRVRFNRYFFSKWMPGDYCHSGTRGCTPEGCDHPCGEHHADSCQDRCSDAADRCRPSPIAGCMADPFVDESAVATPLLTPQQGQPERPAAPEPIPVPPQDDAPAPPQPATPRKLTPLSPVPEDPTSQATIDPPAWPRLQQSQFGRPTVQTRIQPRLTYPASW